jgi:uncharacterized membrane protein YeaQ/YmgE (transglycosylase-associated protein family)
MDMIIQLILGAVGGNAGGALLKNFSMGTVGNSIAGAIGGAGLANLVPAVGAAVGGGMVGNGVSSALGGVALTVVAGFVKNMMAKKDA